MCPFPIQYKNIQNWIFLFCCSNCYPEKIPYEEAQDNIDILNIKYQIYCYGDL